MDSTEWLNYTQSVTYNNLPVLVADDDFVEHLHENGFETIELDELFIEYEDWAKENVDE